MPQSYHEYVNKILELSDELITYKNSREDLISKRLKLEKDLKSGSINQEEYTNEFRALLKNRTYQYWISYYDSYINRLLRQIRIYNSKLYNSLKVPEKEVTISRLGSKKLKESSRISINKKDLKRFVKNQKKIPEKIMPEAEYSVYKSNLYAKISNQIFENLSFNLTKRYPELFKSLFVNLRLADIKLLSKTYVSVMLFTTVISFPMIALISYLFTLSFAKALVFGFLGAIATLLLVYFYPNSLINSRKKKIKNDLVFAIVHMSAISGSGAQPITIFRLLLESGEYKYLGSEIKKILNYINLFGYSLSTSLKAVAASTPSYELKELLNGMVATIETGGDLKEYLHDKAEDALNTYRIDQEKYTAKLSTYSDLYTGILVAAPLLFLLTLTILDKISPTLGSIKISTIASIGTYVVIPLINIGFILFLNLTQQEL